jgi:hypothetical protein
MGQPDRIHLALYWKDRRVGLASTAGRKPDRREPGPPDANFVFRPVGLAAAFEGFKRLLRPLVRVLYLAPALVVLKMVFYVTEVPTGDWITVCFVGLAALFFLLLAVLVFMHLLVGPRSKRPVAPQLLRPDLDALLTRPGLTKEPTRAEAVEQLIHAGGSPGSTALRLRGRARGTGAADGPLVTDSWLATKQQVARLTASRVFRLELGDDARTAVVVDPGDGDVILVGPRGERPTTLELEDGLQKELDGWIARESGGALSVTRLGREGASVFVEEGAEVEVFAAAAEVVENVDELAVAGRGLRLGDGGPGSASAYRGESRRGLLLSGTAEAPLIIRCL